jgi:peptide/nickel transport system ATP-binding protein
MSDKLAVMYLGKIVEMGDTEEVLRNPIHPYTRALISAVPVPDPAYKRTLPEIKGSITKPIDPLPRCRFYDRCPMQFSACREEPPVAHKDGRQVMCWLHA